MSSSNLNTSEQRTVSQPFVSVIIVNYNTIEYLQECLESLKNQRAVNLEIVVVDNASSDDSVQLIKKLNVSNLKLIENKENVGFGRANNIGATHASGDYYLLLNPDTTIKDPLTIAKMVETYDSNHYGMLAPLIEEPRKNKFVYPRYRYPANKYLWFTSFKGLPGEIAWVLGACIFISSKIYHELGGFDPDFFMYGEDVDISLRLRKLGYEIGYNPELLVTHIGGASEFKAESYDKWVRKYNGALSFYKKHYHPIDFALTVMLKKSSCSLKLAFYRLAQFFGFTLNNIQTNIVRTKANYAVLKRSRKF